jgi:hypothetical protein
VTRSGLQLLEEELTHSNVDKHACQESPLPQHSDSLFNPAVSAESVAQKRSNHPRAATQLSGTLRFQLEQNGATDQAETAGLDESLREEAWRRHRDTATQVDDVSD